MHDRQVAGLPERHERRHARVKTKEAIEIQRPVFAAGLLNRNRLARPVVLCLSERDHHVQPVHRAALEHRDEQPAACARGWRC